MENLMNLKLWESRKSDLKFLIEIAPSESRQRAIDDFKAFCETKPQYKEPKSLELPDSLSKFTLAAASDSSSVLKAATPSQKNKKKKVCLLRIL